MPDKNVEWFGSTKEDLIKASPKIRSSMGAALRLAQEGDVSDDARPMRGNLREVMEIVENDTAGTFRLMHTVVIDDNVYVLDFFQKKSKSGIKTPQADIDRITARLADAKKRAAALRVKGPK